MTRIFLILAHTLTRAGLRNCLAGNTDLQVVGDAPDAASGWPQVTQQRPDLVVLDGTALNALHASGRFPSDSDKSPAPTLVLFTDNEAMEQTDSALQAGVRGFIDTATTPEALIGALRRVAAGERYVSPALLPKLTPDEGVPELPETNPESLLSARELEVFILTAGGLESKEIGDRLGISPRTVDVHRANIRQKLGLSGVHELMRYALTWKQNRERTNRAGRFCNERRPLLLVEDDEVDVLSVQRALARLPARFQVEAARNGEEALAWLRNRGNVPPFMILLDINMPRMNGHEFLAELRKDPTLRTLPVVVLTTSPHEADRDRLYAAGITAYFVKPTTTEDFSELFRTLAEFWGFNSPPPYPAGASSLPAERERVQAA